VSIKVLYGLMVLSVAAVIGVAVAGFLRVWWHLKARRPESQDGAKGGSGATEIVTERRRSDRSRFGSG
jgi:uncharacterized membrane protein